MYNGKKILGLIPARGGSKGIPNKNIVDVAGKPLIAYTIEAATASKYLDNVVVTTDSEIIATVSREYGASVPFLRPPYLSTDESKTIEAVIHALHTLKEQFDYLVLLQPTHPLRKTKHIDEAIEQLINSNQTSLVSVSKVIEHPILMRTIDHQGNLHSLLRQNSTVRRQDFQDIYIVDGSIYINKINELSNETSLNDNILSYIMEDEVIDIDEEKDLVKFKLKVRGD